MGVPTHFASIWEAVSDVMGDRPAVVQGERSVSWRDYEDRAARLAGALVAAGLGRDSKVGMYLYNSPEYCETNFGAMKFGAIPINLSRLSMLAGPATPVALATNGSLVSLGQGLGAIWGGVIADGAGFVWLCVGAAALGAVGTVLAAFEPRQSDTDKTGG